MKIKNGAAITTCVLSLFLFSRDTIAQVDQQLNYTNSDTLFLYGTITDSATKEPLPFVDVRYDDGLIREVKSDFDGHYKLQITLGDIKNNVEQVEIRFSFIGYAFPKIKIKTIIHSQQLDIQGRMLKSQFGGELKPYDPSSDLKKMLDEDKFASVRKKKVPTDILKVLGYDSYNKVGTKQRQRGCTSGKRMVINWVERAENGMYIISTSSCGAYSDTFCYVIYKGQQFDMHLAKNADSFSDFKKMYLNNTGS